MVSRGVQSYIKKNKIIIEMTKRLYQYNSRDILVNNSKKKNLDQEKVDTWRKVI
jgi:hypothetical protein